MTDEIDATLRPGLHTCELGDVYDWAFYGDVPIRFDARRHGSYELVGLDGMTEYWPQTAVLAVTNLSRGERQDVVNAARMLAANLPEGSYRDSLMETLRAVAQRPSIAPYLPHRSQWPLLSELDDSEKYLLYRWQVTQLDGQLPTATPVWLVVTDIAPDKYGYKWQVVREVPQPSR